MGYNRENFRRIKQEYETKYLDARAEAETRRAELHARFPEVAEIDAAMHELGVTLLRTAVGGGPDAQAKLAALREQNEALQAARAAFLTGKGYPADYSEVHYACEKCGDTGYVDTKMCDCMKRALTAAGFASSGLGHLLQTQSFENFSLDYYRRVPEQFAAMQRNYDILYRYAHEFTAGQCRNIALFGGTGLGKTHLSTAVARVVIERGYDVCYTTAIDLIGDYEYDRFKGGREDSADTLAHYADCDLLIIDDLGTEVVNQFTVSVIYNLINTRLNCGRSTMISTNHSPKELRERYWDRITSRIFGEYQVLVFSGTDVRAQKLRQ
ncbi:MAG: DNA replication protein DnaC [Ruminococcaceae bacterium]|nr:DNA replication protein DnaC [Oscillospiraceae bacterium]